MKIFILFNILCLAGHYTAAQQVLTAGNVQLVSSAGVQLTVTGGVSFNGSASFIHNGRLNILSNPSGAAANWTDNTTGVISSASSGHILFKDGSLLQQVTGPTRFDSITVQGAGISLAQSNEVRQCLNLNTGLVYLSSTTDSIYISNPAINAVAYHTVPLSSTSWVHGKLSRVTNSTGGTYAFPVGKILGADSLYAPIYIDKINANAATYSAQYFPAEPVDRLNHSLLIDHISGLEYWNITSHNYASAPDDDAALTLSWRKYSTVSTSAAARDSLMIAHYYNGGGGFTWQPEINFGAANIVSGNEYFGLIKSNITIGDFSMPHLNFTIGSRSPFSLLPENTLALSVFMRQCQTQISFTRASNASLQRFEVEWSATGLNWQHIATVKPRVNAGLLQSYTASHASPVAGMNYYRVKQVMHSGTALYSAVTGVRSNCGTAAITAYPNPFTGLLTVNGIGAGATVQLLDAAGKAVISIPRSNNTVHINTEHLPAGHYVLVVTGTGGGMRPVKLVK